VTHLVLSIFPGIGLLDMAFEEEGFCVVRGPDLLWGGDIHKFHPPAGKFDGVIGGPPCQAFSRLRHIVEANGYKTAPNLIPEYERCVREAQPSWFLMENVPGAPTPVISDGWWYRSEVVSDVWVGGDTSRTRRFTFGAMGNSLPSRFRIETLALHRPDPEPAALASGGGRRFVPVKIGGSGKPKGRIEWVARTFAEHCQVQGLPPDFLDGAPFTRSGKDRVVGNGVPLHMGRAVAKAVKKAIGLELDQVA
jgi:DNA (cytosine-5)-methyltransferase 1